MYLLQESVWLCVVLAAWTSAQNSWNTRDTDLYLPFDVKFGFDSSLEGWAADLSTDQSHIDVKLVAGELRGNIGIPLM